MGVEHESQESLACDRGRELPSAGAASDLLDACHHILAACAA